MQATVDWMIGKHYLKRWPGTVMRVFRLDYNGAPCGVCVYSLPPRESFVRYGVSLAWELSRLWITDEMPTNTETWFIAKTIQWIRKNRPEVKCLISYADPAFGHRGTIYHAGNWKADGRTDEKRKTPRVDYVIRGGALDGKLCSRRAHVPPGATVERVQRTSKFRFVYWLKNGGASSLRPGVLSPTSDVQPHASHADSTLDSPHGQAQLVPQNFLPQWESESKPLRHSSPRSRQEHLASETLSLPFDETLALDDCIAPNADTEVGR